MTKTETQKPTHYDGEDMTRREHEIFNAGVNVGLAAILTIVKGIPQQAANMAGAGIAQAVRPLECSEEEKAAAGARVDTFARYITGRALAAINDFHQKHQKRIITAPDRKVVEISHRR